MPDVPLLDAAEQRILESLLEKQVTVPASYPLTLSALRTACNQTSSREPVTDLGEPEVEQTAKALKESPRCVRRRRMFRASGPLT